MMTFKLNFIFIKQNSTYGREHELYEYARKD
jgi:hypothetical protein